MPSVSVGSGIARGAKAFMDSYMQARMQHHQEQLQRNSIILNSVYQQLSDENIPYQTRARLLDSIPQLAGIKMDKPLSEHLGLRDMLEQGVVTDTKPGTPQSFIQDATKPQDNSNQSPVPKGGVSTSDATAGMTSVEQKATQSVDTVQRMGDLSPAKMKLILKKQEQDADTNRNVEEQRRLADINLEMQLKVLKSKGYDRKLSEGTDSNGNYVVLVANDANDVKQIKMPQGFKPLQQTLAETKGAGLPSAARAYAAYFEGQINPLTGQPYTPEEAMQKGLELFKKHGDTLFGLTEQQKKNAVKEGEQRTSGTEPLTPAQKAEIEDRRAAREDRQQALQIQREANHIKLNEEADNAEAALSSHQQIIDSQQQRVNDLQNTVSQMEKDEDFDPEEPSYEYKQKVNELKQERDRLTNLQNQAATVQAKAKSARAAANNYGQTVVGNSDNASSIPKSIIDTFRAKNPSIKNMSDDEIRQILWRNRNRWHQKKN